MAGSNIIEEVKNRNQWVDIAKGIGIILVVYGHVLDGIKSASLVPADAAIMKSYTVIYSFHMPLFFLLSGLFFTKAIQKYKLKGFFINKLKTILYPFVIWSILQTSIEILLSKYSNGNIGVDSLFTCLYQPRAQFWFLYLLFFINLVSAFLYFLSNKYWLYISFAISVFCSVVIIISGNWESRMFFFSIYDLKFLNMFNLGVLLGGYILSDKFIVQAKRLFLPILILFIVCEYMYLLWYNDFSDILVFISYSYVLPVIGSALVICVSIKMLKSKYSTFLSNIGEASLYIYLLHILCCSGVRIILSKVFHIENIAIHLVLGVIVGIFIPYLFVSKMNRFKFFKYLFKIPSNVK